MELDPGTLVRKAGLPLGFHIDLKQRPSLDITRACSPGFFWAYALTCLYFEKNT